MPEISRFFGIVVQMFHRGQPPAHFHVRYGECKASVGIDPVGLLSGMLPPRALAPVIEWASSHREELMEDWELARARRPLKRIAPLE